MVLSSLPQDIVDCPNILHRQCKLLNVVWNLSPEYGISYASRMHDDATLSQ